MLNDERSQHINELADEIVALVKRGKRGGSAAEGMTAMTMAAAALCVDIDERSGRHDSSEVFMKQLYRMASAIKELQASSKHARSKP